ncbi:MAG TPA: TetR/AcrR family transcriptional regulator [Oscillatoriales cyanobacterium M59_W2019_021]|nr:TetR/AcrR family transcriptional regulator [Oscillatoriales cyanobacterium M59_W2019_021]
MPKIVDHQTYRQELLGKCFDLFAQHGYSAITMRQIAQGLGVSTGTLYHYFPSKENIFEQLIEYLSIQDTSAEQLPNLDDCPTLSAKIDAVMEFLAEKEDYISKNILIVMDYIQKQDRQTVLEHPILQAAAERYEKAVARCLGIDDPALAIFVISWFDGLVMRRMLTGEKVSLVEQGKLFGQMLEAYMAVMGNG